MESYIVKKWGKNGLHITLSKKKYVAGQKVTISTSIFTPKPVVKPSIPPQDKSAPSYVCEQFNIRLGICEKYPDIEVSQEMCVKCKQKLGDIS